MTKKLSHEPGNEPPRTARRPIIIIGALLFLVVAVIFWFSHDNRPLQQTAPQPKPVPTPSVAKPATPSQPSPTPTAHIETPPPAIPTNIVTLTNQPMRLQKKVLVSKKWNNGPDAFALDKPPPGKEGATVGPAAVTYFQGKIYVLDEASQLIRGYDQDGRQISSVALPNNVATDLTVDASGTALILIDQMHDSIYKVDGNELKLIANAPLKETYSLGTKFSYDLSSNTLGTQEVHQDGLADIDGSNLIINFKEDQKLSIPFDKPVACVEQVVGDVNGVIWVMYTLDGDYQKRRIARVDRAGGTVGTAEIDVYFAFDATRHMVPSGNGIIVFGGDNQEGRLISFDYAGTGL